MKMRARRQPFGHVAKVRILTGLETRSKVRASYFGVLVRLHKQYKYGMS